MDQEFDSELISIEIAYQLSQKQYVKELHVPTGTSISNAIKSLCRNKNYPNLKKNLDIDAVGINGKVRDLNTILAKNDRIEIYKLLSVDPKARRKIKSLKSTD
ncbi:RnfH family protein [Nitrosomonas sp.]|uniref:RnfH family protein n=1 Tax=Nitrosomonas sp. TaxID=42353 RepID=UPI0025FC15DE|nr:RnfH family protein [Nitrosomonas sp.]